MDRPDIETVIKLFIEALEKNPPEDEHEKNLAGGVMLALHLIQNKAKETPISADTAPLTDGIGYIEGQDNPVDKLYEDLIREINKAPEAIKDAFFELAESKKFSLIPSGSRVREFIRYLDAMPTTPPENIMIPVKNRDGGKELRSLLCIECDTFYIFLPSGMEFNLTTPLFLKALFMRSKENNFKDPLIALSLKRYMRDRDINRESTARAQVNADMDILQEVFIMDKKYKDKDGDFVVHYLFGGTKGIEKGNIFFSFNPNCFKYLLGIEDKKGDEARPQLMYSHKDVLKIGRNVYPLANPLHDYIAYHWKMNHYKTNGNIISIRTLLNHCPDLLRKIDTPKKKQFIIMPFERNMNALTAKEILSWRYAGDPPKNDAGEACWRKEGDPPFSKWSDFIETGIVFEWITPPPKIEVKPKTAKTGKKQIKRAGR
jgi:hypothetical protein